MQRTPPIPDFKRHRRFPHTVVDLTTFLERVEQTDECWIWLGTTTARGYGQVGYKGKSWGAARLSWLLHGGWLAPSMDIHHTCANHSCVRPEHLQLVAHAAHRKVYHRAWG